MLQQNSTYKDTNQIAHDTYQVCEALGRQFAVHKNDRQRYELRCRDCKLASCFNVNARSSVENGNTVWSLKSVNLGFTCRIDGKKQKRQYTTKQLMTWGVIPTASSYIPTRAGDRSGGGQNEQLAQMIKTSDKVHLKKTQISRILDSKTRNTTEHNIQQFGLLQSYLDIDFNNELEARERMLQKVGRTMKTDYRLGAYVLDTQWTDFENTHLATFERLLFTTGYCKAYWNCSNIWRHCELDMCHIKNEFGGFISLLTHSTSNGRNKILAFGIHPAENGEEWNCFFDFCQKHFQGIRHITNDQDKGLKAIEKDAMRNGTLKRVSNCIVHIVRNENVARNKANAGGFNVSMAGGSVQSLATKLAKACSEQMYEFYLQRMKSGNEFTAEFFDSRRSMFSSSYLLDEIRQGSQAVQLSGRIPAESRRGRVSSNTAEQSNSNSGINSCRGLPIIDMVKGIASKMASQHYLVRFFSYINFQYSMTLKRFVLHIY